MHNCARYFANKKQQKPSVLTQQSKHGKARGLLPRKKKRITAIGIRLIFFLSGESSCKERTICNLSKSGKITYACM